MGKIKADYSVGQYHSVFWNTLMTKYTRTLPDEVCLSLYPKTEVEIGIRCCTHSDDAINDKRKWIRNSGCDSTVIPGG